MTSASAAIDTSSGGILFPLDMFRPSVLARALGEYFVSKARNVVDAQLVLTRHPQTQLVLMRIDGSVIGDSEGAFWKEYSELGMLVSQILPRQCVLYYAMSTPERREGFMVTAQGQPLAANDITADRLPPEATDEDWPLAQLCGQFGMSRAELDGGFAGGPSVSISLLEPTGDDREWLTTLATPPEGMEEDGPDGPGGADGGSPGSAVAGAAGGAAGPGGPAGPSGPGGPGGPSGPSGHGRPSSAGASGGQAKAAAPKVDDAKRRAAERDAERQKREAMAKEAQESLQVHLDDRGLVVALASSLEDTDIISRFMVRAVAGDLPEGVSRDLTERLQGKRIDVAVPVEFLSEVFVGANPLSKPQFESEAQDLALAGQNLKVIEVQAPRVGPGVLVRRGRTGLFVSRPADQLPAEFVIAQLDALDGA